MADYGHNNDYNLQQNEKRQYGTNTEAWTNREVKREDCNNSNKIEELTTREDSGCNEPNNATAKSESFSPYIKTSEGYVFPSRSRNDRERGNDYDRHRPRRRRSRSRSRSRERDRRSSSGSYSRDRDRGERHRDRDRSRDRGDRRDRDRRRHRYDDDRPSGATWDDDQYTREPYGSVSNYDIGVGSYGDRGRSLEADDWRDNSAGNNRSNEDEGTLGNKRINGKNWKDRLTSIREAHFNRSKQPPSIAQNQFQNDGSFMEMFKKKMQQSSQGEDVPSVTPNSLFLASQSIPFSPELSLPPLTTSFTDTASSSKSIEAEDVDGTPMVQKTLPMPVSMGKRRMAKPLKTGIVAKKPQNAQEDEGNQEQLDAWAHYLKEVQKYKSSKCMDSDETRPLVK